MKHQGRKIESIQALRGIAALSVVVNHFFKLASEQSVGRSYIWTSGIGPLGAAGVDLFFIISGFVMVISAADQGMRPIEFLVRRALRIYPLYWFFTTVLLVLALRGYFSPEFWSTGYLVASYLLVPYARPNQLVEHVPLLGQGWTLCYEIYFYLIFSLSLGRSRKFPVIQTSLMLALFFIITTLVDAPGAIRYVASSPLILEFILGMFAARLYRWISRSWRYPRSKIFPFLLLCAGGWWALSAVRLGDELWVARATAFGIPCLVIVLGTLMLELSGWQPGRFLSFLGDASYSIYLSHGVFLALASYVLFGQSHMLKFPDVFGLAGSLAAVLVGIATFIFAEKPLRRFIRARRSQKSPEHISGLTGS